MTSLRQAAFRLRSMFRPKKTEAELSEEIRFHLESQTEANLAAGMGPEEARLAALRTFGGMDQIKERYRDERRPKWLEDCWRDLGHSVRSLLRERAFTATVLAIFALCVAANVAIFSVVDGVLLRPLPIPDADGMYSVYNSYPKAGFDGGLSVPHYLERSQLVSAFAESAALRDYWATLGESGSSERVEAMSVSASFFPLVRAKAALGRTFTEDETALGAAHVVVLGDEYWRAHFGSDPGAIGKTLRIDDVPFTVIGVMPRGVSFPAKHPVLWTPLSFTAEERTDLYRHVDSIDMIARLRPGIAPEVAQAQVDDLNQRSLKRDPWAKMVVEGAGYHPVIRSLHTVLVSGIRPVLLLLQGGAVFLMVIGTVNLANLFMVRAVGRAREYGLRRILGAGSYRLGRALLLEATLLSTAGALLGLGVGVASLRATFSYFRDRLPFDVPANLEGRVCLVTLAAAILVGLVIALPVLWHSLRDNLATSLSSESRSGTTTRSVQRLRHALIVTQIALAFVLLSGSGLLSLSMARVLAVNPGFRAENLLTGMVDLPTFKYRDQKQQVAVVQRIVAAIRALPGVKAAGVDTALPFTWGGGGAAIAFKGMKLTPDEAAQPHKLISVAGDVFAALGVPLVEGRRINDDDVQVNRMVCVVDAEFARRYWPKGDALGHQITPDSGPNPFFFTIVGIVGVVKQNTLTDEGDYGSIYLPYYNSGSVMLALRTLQPPESVGPALREAIARIDPDLSVTNLKPMSERVEGSLTGRWLSLALASVFAGLAMVLAAIGIYGVLAYTVATRRREIGVRMALGARPDQIRRLFLGLSAKLLAMSLPIGCVGALLMAKAMSRFLYGVSPLDPGVLLFSAMTLSLVALAACFLPARRAAHVEPAEALKSN